MKAQWIILIWVVITSFLCAKEKASDEIPDIKENRVSKGGAFLVFSVPVLIMGLRSKACDTGGYIGHFKRLPPSSSRLYSTFSDFARDYSKGKGFYYFSYLIKRFISRDYHIWFLIICALSLICVLRLFRKYSPDFRMSSYLYITSCIYSWLINGMRQYLAVCVCFFLIEFGLKKKIWYDVLFVLAVLVLSTFHTSAYIMLPIYFIAVRQPALTKRTNIILAVSLVVIIALVITGVYDRFVGDSEYSDDVKYYEYNPGTSISRVIIHFIPVILIIINYKKIKEMLTPFIGITVNMAFINAGLYLFSSFRHGMLEGRLPAYTEIYNVILYPWLLKYVYKDSKTFKAILLVVYFIFFYYQMKLTWDGLGYQSDVLKFLN